MARNHAHVGKADRKRDLQDKAWKLRIRGASIREVATALEMSTSTVVKYLHETAALLREQTLDSAEQHRQMEVERLDRVVKRLEGYVFGDDSSVDHRSRAAYLKVYLQTMERRAKLLGLDAPEKKEVTFRADISPDEIQRIVDAASDEEREALRAGDAAVMYALAERAGVQLLN